LIKEFLQEEVKKKKLIGQKVTFGITRTRSRIDYKIEKGSIATTLFAYNHKTMNGNQPFTERFLNQNLLYQRQPISQKGWKGLKIFIKNFTFYN
jgi:hypothetical protein